MAKKNQHAKQGYGINDPQDAIHMGEGKRIRLEDVPLDTTSGDQQIGNRIYNDARYMAKGTQQATSARWLIAPVIQWSGTGLIYFVSSCKYELPGISTPITAAATSKTLFTADPSNPRFDRFVWNEQGQCLVIEGTPSPDPVIPEAPDPLTQIAGQAVLVGAGATEPPPSSTTTVVIYNENVEWAGAFFGTGSANFNTGTPTFTGFKSAYAYAIVQHDYIEWTSPTDFNPASFISFGMQMRLNASMLTNQDLELRFYNNANQAVSNGRNLLIDKNLVNDWQFVSINLADFTFSSNTARKVRLRWTRGNNAHPGYYLDLVQLQGGIPTPVVAGTVQLQGHVVGSGQTGVPIQTTITEKAISSQTEHTDPLPSTAYSLWRLADGTLRRVAASLLGTGHTHANQAALDQVSGINTGDQDLSGKVDKVAGKSLIDDTEIDRLAGINDRFKGKYTSLANLQSAHPTANAGDYAQVDTGASNPVSNYNWDVEDGWVIGSTGGVTISNTDELPEGSTNFYLTFDRVRNTTLTGISFLTNRAIVAGDTILVAMGLLQKQISDAIASIAGKQDTLVSGTNIRPVNGNSLLGSSNLIIPEALGGPFQFNVATTDTDPGAGKIAFNHATAASVTFLYIDYLNDGATDISNYTKSLRAGDVIFIQNKDSVANWARFRVTANAVDGTGYYKIAVVYVNGNAAIPTTNQNLLVVYNLQNESGGGVGGNFIAFDVAQVLTGGQKQQALDNIGSSAGSYETFTNSGTLTINDLAITKSNIEFRGASTITLTGIVPLWLGHEVSIYNETGNPLTIVFNSGLSGSFNRFQSALVIPQRTFARFKYVTLGGSNFWVATSTPFSYSVSGSGITYPGSVGIAREPVNSVALAVNTFGSVGLRVYDTTGFTTLFETLNTNIRSNVNHGFGTTPDVTVTIKPLAFNIAMRIYNTSSVRTVDLMGDGNWQSTNGAFFGASSTGSVPVARVDIRGRGTSTGNTLLLEDSAGTDNVYFIDNGQIRFLRLPTSSAGLASGSLWNNEGVINIV